MQTLKAELRTDPMPAEEAVPVGYEAPLPPLSPRHIKNLRTTCTTLRGSIAGECPT